MPGWWELSKNLARRLELETLVMQATFCDTFRLEGLQSGKQIYWLGTVELNLIGVPHREHTLKILYPDEYPNKPPEVYVLSPEIRSEIYQHKNGKLSLFNPKDGPNYGWNPTTSTAATLTGWAIQWLYCYYTWRLSGVWPDVRGEDLQK